MPLEHCQLYVNDVAIVAAAAVLDFDGQVVVVIYMFLLSFQDLWTGMSRLSLIFFFRAKHTFINSCLYCPILHIVMIRCFCL